MSTTTLEMAKRAEFLSRGRKLEYFSIGYNLLESVIGLAAGFLSGSVVLVGFSIDSLIEVTSSLALLWRLRQDEPADRERIERASLRVVGLCFAVLAAYVAYEAVTSLLHEEAPSESIVGIVLGVVSIIVMPILAREKRKVAVGLDSGAMEADAKQTDFCFYLSFILVGGLALNALFGWWWADPAAGLAMVPIIAIEGYRALRGKNCGCSERACH